MTARIKTYPLILLAFYAFLVFPLAPVWAQGAKPAPVPDTVRPIIKHNPPAHPVREKEPLIIQAIITDNVAVRKASVYYRFIGTREYFSIHMNTLGGDVYSVIIPEQYIQVPGIEYYIEAMDPAGNLAVFQGLSFSPLTVKVVASEENPWYKKWWVWTIVGGVIIAAGAGIAASGGGGDGGGPTTGSVSINETIP